MNIGGESFELYREEARELLVAFEHCLIQLDERPDDLELVSEAFRCLHTIKGSGSMFGFTPLVDFVHQLESIFQKFRSGSSRFSRELIDAFLVSKDIVSSMIEDPGSADSMADDVREVVSSFPLFLRSGREEPHAGGNTGAAGSVPVEESLFRSEPESPDKTVKDLEGKPGSDGRYAIHFRPDAGLFRVGSNPLAILGELEELGTVRISCDISGIPPLTSIDPEACYFAWRIELDTQADENSVRDVFIFVEDTSEIVIDRRGSGSEPEQGVVPEPVTPEPVVTTAEPDAAATPPEPVQIPEETQETGDPTLSDAVGEARTESEAAPSLERVSETTSIRSDRIGFLVERVGEFLSMHARLASIAESRNDPELSAFVQQFDAMTREIRDISLELSLEPASSLFSLIRSELEESSGAAGIRVTLLTEGDGTEIDRETLALVATPFRRFFRETVDAVAAAAGESAEPVSFRLSARRDGATLCIDIVSDVQSGEAIGTPIETLRQALGSIHGTVSALPEDFLWITVRLPVASSITEGLLVGVGDEMYVIDIACILGCVDHAYRESASGRRIVEFRGEMLPFIDLRAFFGVDGNRGRTEQMVILSHSGVRAGLLVDSVLDTVNAVVKPLGGLAQGKSGVNGAVLMGDGRLALVLDVESFLKPLGR